MRLVKKNYRKKIGEPPGTLLSEEHGQVGPVQCRLIEYSPDTHTDRDVDTFSDLSHLKNPGTISWLNVLGLENGKVLDWIGGELGIHPLVLEDIQNTGQRPKLDDYTDYLYITCRMLSWDEQKDGVDSEQVSFLVGQDFLITFQERPGDVFDIIRKRIAEGKGRVRTNGADYLAYALIDAIIDHYYIVVEHLQDQYEELEDRVLFQRSRNTVRDIHSLRKEIVVLRRAVWPLRDMMNQIRKGDAGLICESTVPYFGDVSDHVSQIIEADELLREMLTGVLDYYQSAMSNDMNAVMKVLTIIATIFIPLTFVAGIYGMNFHWMPELAWRWGYPAVLGLMALIVLGLIIYFRKKKWL